MLRTHILNSSFKRSEVVTTAKVWAGKQCLYRAKVFGTESLVLTCYSVCSIIITVLMLHMFPIPTSHV